MIRTAFIMIICFSLPVSALANKPVTIVDHYKSLPDKATGEKISLTVRDRQWVRDKFQHGCGELVDVKNGYMEFKCTGDGSSKDQYTLFLKDDGIIVIGVSRYGNNGACRSTSSIGFYEKKDGAWSDVTGNVLPKIDYTMFLRKNYNKNKFNDKAMAVIKKYLQYNYGLPRHGLKVTISINPSPQRCVIKGKQMTAAELSILKTDGILDLFRERTMEWDAKNGKFKLLP